MANSYEYIIYLRDKMSGQMKRVGATSSATYQKINRQQQTLNTSTERYGRIARRVFGGYIGVMGVKAFAKFGTEIKQARIQLQTLTGSESGGNKLFKNVQDFANRTPYLNRQVTNAATTLMAFGVANEKVIPAVKMLGDIAGGNKDRFRALALAYAQSQSAGKLMGQDLLQMVNAGFNPLQIMSKKTGLSIAQLRKQMEKGAISSKMVEDAFITATSAGGRFYGMMDKMSKESFGLTSTIQGQLIYGLSTISAKMHDGFKPILTNLVSVSQRFVQWSEKVDLNADKIGRWIGIAGKTVKLFAFYKLSVIGIGAGYKLWNVALLFNNRLQRMHRAQTLLSTISQNRFAGALKMSAFAWRGLNTAMKANVIGLALTSIPILVGWIKKLRDRTKEAGWAMKAYNIESRKSEYLERQEAIEKKLSAAGLLSKKAGFTQIDVSEEGRGKFQKLLQKSGIEELRSMQTMFETQSAEVSRNIQNIKNNYAKNNTLGKNKGSLLQNALRWDKQELNRTKGFLKEVNEQIKIFDKASGGSSEFSVLNESATNITSGGSRPTNITINLKNLVESLEVKTENLQESGEKIRDIVTEQLLRALNSANFAVNPT